MIHQYHLKYLFCLWIYLETVVYRKAKSVWLARDFTKCQAKTIRKQPLILTGFLFVSLFPFFTFKYLPFANICSFSILNIVNKYLFFLFSLTWLAQSFAVHLYEHCFSSEDETDQVLFSITPIYHI